MRRSLSVVFSVLLAVAVIAGCAPAAQPTATTPPSQPTAAPTAAPQSKLEQLYQAAKAAGETEVVLMQSLAEMEDLKEFIDAFEKRFPGIKLTINELVPAQQSQRIVTEAQAKRMTMDIAVVDVSAAKDVFDRDLVLSLDYTGTGVAPSDILLDGKGVFADVNTGGVLYNKTLIPANEVPTSWQDLLDPKWEGKIGSSSTAGGIQPLAGWTEEEAEKFLQAMGKQKVKVFPSGTAVVQAVAQGEVAIVWAVLGNAVQPVREGAPIGVAPIMPLFGAPTYFVAVKDSPHPNAAKLFMAWLGEPEAKAAIAKAGFGPFTPCGPKPATQLLCGRDDWTFLYENTPEMVAKAAKVRQLAIKYVTQPTQ